MEQKSPSRPGFVWWFRFSLALNVLLICLAIGFVVVSLVLKPPFFPPLGMLDRPPNLLERLLSVSVEPDRLAAIKHRLDENFPPDRNPLRPPPQPPGPDGRRPGGPGSPEEMMQRFIAGPITREDLAVMAVERNKFQHMQEQQMDTAIIELSRVLTRDEKEKLVENLRGFGEKMRACEMDAFK